MKNKFARVLGASSLLIVPGLSSALGTGCGTHEERQEPAVAKQGAALNASQFPNLAFPEYDLNVPVEVATFPAGTAAEINAKRAEGDGFRLHDLSVVSTSPLLFSAQLVRNQGPYARAGGDWRFDLTEAELRAIEADSANRRIVDIAQYQGLNGEQRYAAVWVSNTLAQQRNYKLVLNAMRADFEREAAGTPGHSYRVVSLDRGRPTPCNGGTCISFPTYSGVMTENGAPNGEERAQTFGFGTMAELMAAAQSNGRTCSAATIDCTRLALVAPETPTGPFYYVMEQAKETQSSVGFPILGEGEQTWWASGLFYQAGNPTHPDNLEHMIKRLGARVQRLTPYTTPEGTRYIATFAQNVDDPNIPSHGTANDGNALLNEIDQIAKRQLRRLGAPGLTLAISQDGHLVHAKGYGYSNMENLRETQPTDLFRIASISKVLTKAAIVRVATEGATFVPAGGGPAQTFTLDTKPWGTIWSYVPRTGSGPKLSDISIRDMLIHKTGLRYISPNFCGCPTKNPLLAGCTAEDVPPCSPFGDIRMDWIGQEDWLLGLDPTRPLDKDNPLDVRPRKVFYVHNDETDSSGNSVVHKNACPASLNNSAICQTTSGVAVTTPLNYQNDNYSVLGDAIARVKQKTFDNYVHEAIFDPLHLTHLRLGKHQGPPGPDCPAPPFPANLFHAFNYQTPLPYRAPEPGKDAPLEQGNWVMCDPFFFPAGSYSATPTDLLRFAASLSFAGQGNVPMGYELLTVTRPDGTTADGRSTFWDPALRGVYEGVSHNGYLPHTTFAGLEDIPIGGSVQKNIKFAYAFNSDVMEAELWGLTGELRATLVAKSTQLPNRDVFSAFIGWEPSALAPSAWYVASQGDVSLTNQSVTQWLDRSGYGRNLAQSATGWQPTFNPTGWAGKPTLTFDGGDMLRLDHWNETPGGDDKAFTVLAVMRSAVTQNAGVASWWNEFGQGAAWAQLKTAGTRTLADLSRTDPLLIGQVHTAPYDLGTRTHVVAWRFSPEVAKVTVDGVTATSSPQSSLIPITNDNTFLVGATSHLPTGLFRGDISELVVVPSSISDADVAAFRDYAQRTWGGLDTGPAPSACRNAVGQALPSTTVCDDGNPATVRDRCTNGNCVGQTPPTGNPGALSPLVWYSAQDLDITTTGTPVLQWFDRSSNRRHLTQAHPPGRPTFNATGWNNSQATLTFSGSNAFRRDTWSDPPAGNDRAFTVLAVLRSNTTTPQTGGIAAWWSSSGDRALARLKSQGGQTVLDLFRSNGDSPSQTFSTSQGLGTGRHVVVWRFSPERATFTLDGTTTVTATQPSLGPISSEMFLVGATNIFGTEFFRGDLAELAVIPSSISDTAVVNFRNYAKQTWTGLP